MREYVYVAGSLFSEADIKQRIFEGESIINAMHNEGIEGLHVFNPITNPFNDKSTLPSAKDIFLGDYKVIQNSRAIFLNLDNPLDAGVMVELGQALEMIENGKDLRIFPVLSDIRVATAGEYDGIYVPYGYNQYVIGALEYYGIHIYDSFDAALLGFVVSMQNKPPQHGASIEDILEATYAHMDELEDVIDELDTKYRDMFKRIVHDLSSMYELVRPVTKETFEQYIIIKYGYFNAEEWDTIWKHFDRWVALGNLDEEVISIEF